jgi:hypothetical protein
MEPTALRDNVLGQSRGLIGTDYAATASATTAIGGVGGYVWGSSAGLVDDVRAWLADPATNFGFILVSQGEASLGSGRRFGSKEQPGGATLPAQLTVTYTMVPEPAVAGLCLVGLAGLVLTRRHVRGSRGSEWRSVRDWGKRC